jgi:hypothetical protein
LKKVSYYEDLKIPIFWKVHFAVTILLQDSLQYSLADSFVVDPNLQNVLKLKLSKHVFFLPNPMELLRTCCNERPPLFYF